MDTSFIIGEISLGFKPEKCNWNCKSIGNWLLLKKALWSVSVISTGGRNLLRVEFCKLNSQSGGATTKWAAAHNLIIKNCVKKAQFCKFTVQRERLNYRRFIWSALTLSLRSQNRFQPNLK